METNIHDRNETVNAPSPHLQAELDEISAMFKGLIASGLVTPQDLIEQGFSEEAANIMMPGSSGTAHRSKVSGNPSEEHNPNEKKRLEREPLRRTVEDRENETKEIQQERQTQGTGHSATVSSIETEVQTGQPIQAGDSDDDEEVRFKKQARKEPPKQSFKTATTTTTRTSVPGPSKPIMGPEIDPQLVALLRAEQQKDEQQESARRRRGTNVDQDEEDDEVPVNEIQERLGLDDAEVEESGQIHEPAWRQMLLRQQKTQMEVLHGRDLEAEEAAADAAAIEAMLIEEMNRAQVSEST